MRINMKITNIDINPVEEELENKQNFIRVMPFLDHPKILSEIQKLRKELGLKELIPYEKYQEWFDKKISIAVSKRRDYSSMECLSSRLRKSNRNLR